MTPHRDLAPHRGDLPARVDQEGRATEELDAQASDADASRHSEGIAGDALRIRQQGEGKSQLQRPAPVGIDRVVGDSRDPDAERLERVMGCAKLAQLANSSRRAVSDIEEQHLRAVADVGSKRERRAVVVGEGQIGDGVPDHFIGAA